MSKRESNYQSDDDSRDDPEESASRARRRQPNDTASKDEPNPGIRYKHEISVEPPIAERKQRAHAVVVSEIHECVPEPSKIRYEKNLTGPERSSERIATQTKPAVEKHQHQRQPGGENGEPEKSMSQSPM